MQDDLRSAIIRTANSRGLDPTDLATAISYETGGTFDPWKRGPTTKWGTHRGLIQWGEPQQREYGVYKGMPVADQMDAVGRYLDNAGVKPGMGLLDIYSAINAGHVGRYEASDGPGNTVRSHVDQMNAEHRAQAARLVGGTFTPTPPIDGTPIFQGDNPYNDVRPTDVRSDQEQFDWNQEQAKQAPYSFFEAVPAAIQSDWALSWALRGAGNRAVDPDFAWKPQDFTEATKDIPEDYHDYILDAHSQGDAEARIQWAREDVEREQRLAGMGLTGTGIRLATSLIDPTAILATAATEGAAGPLIASMKMAKVGRILLSGAAAGAGNALAEAATSTVNPKIDTDDILSSFAVGAVLGGAVGALRHSPHTQDEAAILLKAGQSGLRPKAPDPKDTTALTQPTFGSTAGAASTGERPHLLRDTPIIDDGAAPEAAFGGARFDVGGQLGSSESEITRTVAAHFGEEAVGFKDRSVVPDSATVVQRVLHGKNVRNWQTVAYPAFKAWAKERNQWGTFKRPRAWEQFNEEVARFIEDQAPAADTSPHVSRAAQEFRAITANYADLATNPLRDKGGTGAPLFQAAPDKFYLPKYADHEKINDILERHDWETVRRFVKQAVYAKRPDMDEALADKIASGWLKRITQAGYGMEDRASMALAQGDREAFREAFTESLTSGRVVDSDLTDADIAAIFDEIGDAKAPQESGFSRGKRRTLLDYGFEAGVRGRDGSTTRLSMRDFFSTDADFVINRYSRQMSGRLALAQMQIRNPSTGELIIDGIRTRAEFEKLHDWIRDDWQKKAGLSHAEKSAGADRDVANLKYLWDSVTGTPHYNTREGVYQWMRRAREFNFIRLMNRMGINQAQEFARMFGSLGVKATLSQMPAVRRIIDSAGRSVPRGDRLLQELEAATGQGLEMDFGHYRHRYEDERIGTQDFGRVGRSIDRALDTGKRITADISLMTHLTSIQKKWTMKAVSQRLYDMAEATKGGRDLNALGGKDLAKLRSIGMSDADLKDVFKAMLRNATTPGEGSRLMALNLDKWDPEVRARFVNTMHRWTNRVIHENDAATLNRWMSQPVVMMMTQFRSFMLGSWAKSTLYNLHHFDARTFATMMLEMAAGATTWALTQGMLAAGRPDRDEYLAEKFTPENLAKAAFSRAGFSSLIPSVFDTVSSFTPLGAQFDFRTSGTATGFLLGNSTADMIDSLAQFTSGVSDAALKGRPLSQQEIQAGARTLPFGNFLPFSTALTWAISDQPRLAPRD
jgi:hypothetical protein